MKSRYPFASLSDNDKRDMREENRVIFYQEWSIRKSISAVGRFHTYVRQPNKVDRFIRTYTRGNVSANT